MDIIGRSPLFLRMAVSTTTIAITATACVRFVSFHLISLNRSKVVEFDKYAIKSYNAIHGTDFMKIPDGIDDGLPFN